MEMLPYGKNQERYLVSGMPESGEDNENHVRQYWSLREMQECCFPGCTQNSWVKAKKDLWSLEDGMQVLKYLKHHAMASTLHHNQKEGEHNEHWKDEQQIDEMLMSTEIAGNILEVEDTYDVRQSWREFARRENQKLGAAAVKLEAASSWDDQQQWPKRQRTTKKSPEDGTTVALHQKVQNMQNAMEAMQQQLAGAGKAPADATPVYIQNYLKALDVHVTDPSLNLTEVQEKHVSMPLSQIHIMKETVVRSKEAVRLMTPLNSLRIELSVLANTEDVLENVIQAHKKP